MIKRRYFTISEMSIVFVSVINARLFSFNFVPFRGNLKENNAQTEIGYNLFTTTCEVILKLNVWCWFLRYIEGASWRRRLVAGLTPRRPGFTPWSVLVGFVVNQVALGHGSPPPSSSVFHCQYHSTVALYTHLSPGGWTIGPLMAAVQRHILAHRQCSSIHAVKQAFAEV
jgi:hypothetical protein